MTTMVNGRERYAGFEARKCYDFGKLRLPGFYDMAAEKVVYECWIAEQ